MPPTSPLTAATPSAAEPQSAFATEATKTTPAPKAVFARPAFSHLLTPETLASLVELNADGSVKVENGLPVRKDARALNEQETLMFGLIRQQVHVQQGGAANYNFTATDHDVFKAVSGHTIVDLGGGLINIVDEAGRPVPSNDPAWHLQLLLSAPRASGDLDGEITLDELRQWMDAVGPEIPKEWQDRARAFFADATLRSQADL